MHFKTIWFFLMFSVLKIDAILILFTFSVLFFSLFLDSEIIERRYFHMFIQCPYIFDCKFIPLRRKKWHTKTKYFFMPLRTHVTVSIKKNALNASKCKQNKYLFLYCAFKYRFSKYVKNIYVYKCYRFCT